MNKKTAEKSLKKMLLKKDWKKRIEKKWALKKKWIF